MPEDSRLSVCWISPPSRIVSPLLTLTVLLSRRCWKVGESICEVVVLTTVLTDWLRSIVT